MGHAKLPRKSTNIDMTAMCDVAFLLLTFFMLATKFKPDEPVVVKTPKSVSEIIIPDADIMLITVDPTGKIFFSIDNKLKRKELIDELSSQKSLNLSESEKTAFALGSSMGYPFSQLKSFLGATPDEQKAMEEKATGIPADTAINIPTNELGVWIDIARHTNPKLRICIKADGAVSFPNFQKVIKTLEGEKVFKFNLITDLEAVPMGTDAYIAKYGKGTK